MRKRGKKTREGEGNRNKGYEENFKNGDWSMASKYYS